MTAGQKDPAPTSSVPPTASPSAAVAGGVGVMAVCCTLTLLIAAGVLGSLSGLLIGGIAVGAGIAVAAAVWVTLIWLHRRRVRRDGYCDPDLGPSGDSGASTATGR